MDDKTVSLQQLKDQITQFCAEREWGAFHGPKDLAIGASTESAELLEIFRFRSDAECEALMKDPSSRQEIADEIADVFFFVLRLSEKYGFDLTESFLNKMKKNAAKYPVEKSKGSNQKYTAYSEPS